jgi:hypothetical protein
MCKQPNRTLAGTRAGTAELTSAAESLLTVDIIKWDYPVRPFAAAFNKIANFFAPAVYGPAAWSYTPLDERPTKQTAEVTPEAWLACGRAEGLFLVDVDLNLNLKHAESPQLGPPRMRCKICQQSWFVGKWEATPS